MASRKALQNMNRNQNPMCHPLKNNYDNNDESSLSGSFLDQSFDEIQENEFFSSDNELEEDNNYSQDYLYPSSDISCNEFLCAISAIKLKHNLAENACPKSLHGFEKELIKSNKAKFYSHCKICNILGDACDFEKYNSKIKNCEKCLSILSTFVCFDLEEQIISILNDKSKFDQIIDTNLKSKINHPHFSLKSPIDGKIYKSSIASKFSSENVLSLVLNTDGCHLTKSNKYSLWPLLGSVLELRPSTREKFDNVIILGNLMY
ncbi:unnamed protein product [Brachionus calyciflorus]|uniref:Uncharacterized protein n=1 Tax=Brachionus calyciflorus TaxID=104777 RepID=A0A814GQU5_9BILA|nr:unnamed protein product [Brachionus calyciflorus]